MPANATKRGRKTTRQDLQGAKGWQLDIDGSVYEHRRPRKLERDDNGCALVEIRSAARSIPVLPAYGDGSKLWFVDELVCWHYVHKTPISLQPFVRVVHKDGDPGNDSRDNLLPVLDREWWEKNESLRWVELWSTETAPNRLVKSPDVARFGESREVAPRDLRGAGVTERSIRGLPPGSAIDLLPEHHELPRPTWTYRAA